MNDYSKEFWSKRLNRYKKALEANNFEVHLADDLKHARRIFRDLLLPEIAPQVVSYGDSLTMHAAGILDEMRANGDIRLIDTFDESIDWREVIERRKSALHADLFLTGTNSVTEKGQLVNLDMIGNRVAALTFGPKKVVLFIGRNKFVKDLDAAMERIRSLSAPLNAMRHQDLKTPCKETSICVDCKSPQRICNTWTITEKSYPKGRIKIVLINQEVGL